MPKQSITRRIKHAISAITSAGIPKVSGTKKESKAVGTAITIT
jgi:hypothetical protein